MAGAAHAQIRGQADVALQGYYLGGSSQPLIDTSGIAVHFQSFVPGWGLLSGSFEGYGAQNQLRTGENFLELRGAPWMGQHWTITGGDFHTPASLVEFPFSNIYTPEITARGFKIQASHGENQFTVFGGEETLTAGPRVPYRELIPQTVLGTSVVRKLGKSFRIGGRFLQFSSSPQAIANNPYLFPAGRQFTLARTFSVQALYTPVKRLKLYAEASQPQAPGQIPLLSTLAGAVWETSDFAVRGNYAREGLLYLPMAGYYAGDRQGPFAEVRFRPSKRLEFFVSANNYRNNLERDPNLPFITGTGMSASATALLPLGFSGSAQISTLRFTSQAPGEDPLSSNNRQLSATLSRGLRRHTLHATWRDIKLDMAPAAQRQRSTELEDMVQIKRLFVGGAVRLQQSTGTEQRNTLYYRGSAQGSAGRLSVFANVEIGNDLVNRTVFSTNTYSTTVAGVGLRLVRDWNLQAEVFRNKLNVDLNPESIFVLQAGGLPVSQNISNLEQWSLFIRLTKQIRWGGGLPRETMGAQGAMGAPLVGTVTGAVRVTRLDGQSVAAGIPVSLDGTRTATTGGDGFYTFSGVEEGPHEVAISAAELPAEYDPGSSNQARVLVQPRRMVRADFDVLPLSTIEGKVIGPEGAALDSILIRLLPGKRYTMTDNEGRFAFHNLREGDYQVALDPATLPEGGEAKSPATVTAAMRIGVAIPTIEFSFAVNQSKKPIRKVLDRK